MAWLDNLWEDSWKGNKRLGGFFEGGSFLELVLPACHKSAFKEGNIKSTAFAGIPAGFGNTLCWYFFTLNANHIHQYKTQTIMKYGKHFYSKWATKILYDTYVIDIITIGHRSKKRVTAVTRNRQKKLAQNAKSLKFALPCRTNDI